MKPYICILLMLICSTLSSALEKNLRLIKRENKELKKAFEQILPKSCTFKTCLISNFDSIDLIATLMTKSEHKEAEKVKKEVKENLEKMEKNHNICHSVSIQDAKLFYHNYPSLSGCVDELLHVVTYFKTRFTKIPDNQILDF